jgi:ketosteroid isomerase-like protein
MGAANVELVRLALTDLEAMPALLSEDLVWHFAGDVDGIGPEHRGRDAVFSDFWGKLFELTDGTFSVEPIEIWPAGPELVMAHLVVSMTTDGVARSVDTAVIYRIVDGLIVEAFDVPSKGAGVSLR